MVDGSIKISTQIDQSGFNAGVRNIESSLTSLKGSLKKFAATVGIAFGVGAIVSFGKASIKAAADAESALRGLRSVIEGQGRSWKVAKGFLNDYISDGLMPLTNATTAYKNLAMRGYNDQQIQSVLTALKDSATFGRQASLTLGEAVASATEGLKNENSILVDNAGVTKNVSMMWADYAKQIGVGAGSLTKQQKIQAEVNGILEETRFQVGDSAKALSTYNGLIMQLQFNFLNLKVAVGNALIPIARAVLPGINAIIKALTRAMNLFAQFTTAIFGRQATAQRDVATTASEGAKAENDLAKATGKAGKAAEKAGKQTKGALAQFDELNVLAKDAAEGLDGSADLGIADLAGTDVGADAGMNLGEGVEVSPEVQAAVDAFMAILEPLQAINFDNLSDAFERLKIAAEPLTRALFAGLEWAYLNLFVPLAKWTIENLLPAFLDVLAGALEVLASVIEALKPLGMWLWEVFLKPLATWTGGAIVDILEWLTKGLQSLSDWITEHKGTVETLTIIIGSIAIALGLVMLVLKLWDAALMTSIAIHAIATGAAGTLAAAFMMINWPLVLIVAAIAAVIAIVILLVKHWDEIKAVALGCWEKIKETWEVVADWFDETVVTPIDNFFSGLWGGVKEAAGTCIDKIKEVWGTASTWFTTKVIDPVKNAFKTGINFMIGIAEGFVNRFIRGINAIISAINSILSFDLPDIMGGGKIGLSIPSVGEISIPRLATGAVIPPNAQFAAILGDQTSGRNLEAPEGLIRKIFREEFESMGGSQPMNVDMPVYLDGREIYRNQKRIEWQRGRNLIKGAPI